MEYVRNRDPRMPDDQVLEWATKEKLIIITTDKDFETMIWREGRKFFGLVRLENLPRIERNALVPERKLSKTVISSVARNFMVLLILTFKISPFGRNDKKWGFRSGTN